MDGNYGGTFDVRMARADTVIFLDRSRWWCLYCLVKRTLRGYGRTRTDMAPGCKERFEQRLRALSPSKEVVVLDSNTGVQAFLRSVNPRVGTKNDYTCN